MNKQKAFEDLFFELGEIEGQILSLTFLPSFSFSEKQLTNISETTGADITKNKPGVIHFFCKSEEVRKNLEEELFPRKKGFILLHYLGKEDEFIKKSMEEYSEEILVLGIGILKEFFAEFYFLDRDLEKEKLAFEKIKNFGLSISKTEKEKEDWENFFEELFYKTLNI